jgi:hypothetical protein
MDLESAIARQLALMRAAPQRAALLAQLSAYARAVVGTARDEPAEAVAPAELSQAMTWLQQPIFICGHHRSGTTLLQQLLDGHPDLLVLPSEGTYFTSFHYVARARPSTQALEQFIEDWVCRFVDPNHEPHFKIGRSAPDGNPSLRFAQRLPAWHAALQVQRPTSASLAALLALAAAYREIAAPGSQPRQWVEKTPLNEQHIERLRRLPQARFIQLVRAPDATLASLLARYRATGAAVDVGEHGYAIGKSLRLATRNSALLPDRYLVVRYEDLRDAPEREMRRVAGFLQIDWHATLTTPSVGGQPARTNSSFAGGDDAAAPGGSGPGVVHRARNNATLPPPHARLMRAFTAGAAGRWGYPSEPLSPPARTVLQLRQLPPRALRRLRAALRAISRRRH